MNFLDRLHEITAKNPKELDNEEIAFLRARRVYLTPLELQQFGDLIQVEDPVETTVEPVIQSTQVEKNQKIKEAFKKYNK